MTTIIYSNYRSLPHPETLRRRVKKGAAYLDEHYPDWERKINLSTLEMSESCFCIVGQLRRVQEFLDISSDLYARYSNQFPPELGLDLIVANSRGYNLLNHYWDIEIRRRLND